MAANTDAGSPRVAWAKTAAITPSSRVSPFSEGSSLRAMFPPTAELGGVVLVTRVVGIGLSLGRGTHGRVLSAPAVVPREFASPHQGQQLRRVAREPRGRVPRLHDVFAKAQQVPRG